MTTCYINGKYKPLSQSTVSVTDRGFQFSDGVYEVISVFKNEFVDFKLHSVSYTHLRANETGRNRVLRRRR